MTLSWLNLFVFCRSIMLDRAETLLHDHYAGKDYWDVSEMSLHYFTCVACHITVPTENDTDFFFQLFFQFSCLARLCPHLTVWFLMQTRRSMVFAKHLRLIGDNFRAKHLNSTDTGDQTIYSEDWTRMKVSDTPDRIRHQQLLFNTNYTGSNKKYLHEFSHKF